MASLMIVGVIVGALSVIVVQALLILYIIRLLFGPGPTSKSPKLPVPAHPTTPLSQNQGILWVLDPGKHPKIPAADQNKKRDTVEVAPVQKLAKVKDGMLILIEADGSVTKIILKGCKVVAVSATSLPTRKWAKRYPIKVESKDGAVYQGSKILYIFAETSWEKESWCKALRLASSDDKERLLWFSKITEEFRGYLKSLSDSYPFLIKPSAGYQLGHLDKANRFGDPPSKVRQLWRKLSKKTSIASIDEKRIADRCHVSQDHTSLLSTAKHALPGKMPNDCEEDSSSSASCRSGSSAHVSENYDAETAEKCVIDEGTLCWNLLVSRLFFDAKNNLDIRNYLKARIQRSLSTMRIPTYIGEVTCTDVDPGYLPPYIRGMRAVPTDMNDVWAMEMDIEYSGGVALYIETRLEVRELDLPNGIKDHNIESTDHLENLKHLQEEFELSDGKNSSSERKDSEDPKLEMLSSRACASMSISSSRWKSLLNSVAKHVSQVPLTLTIRVATLRGTIQLHMKPPPSDQIWFGFTCMPDIQFQLESSVKDHKVTNGRVASFLINRFKASILETLVLPNCESMGVSWMLAEKDDWVPRNVAPLMWLNREAPADTFSNESTVKTTEDMDLENKRGKQKRIDPGKQSINEVNSGEVVSSITTTLQRCSSESSLTSHDLKVPLLQNEEVRNLGIIQRQDNPECHLPSSYVSLREERSDLEDDDGKVKWLGTKARMLDLGKKMGEKLEEKRRHIEERSRHIVEKMRGP